MREKLTDEIIATKLANAIHEATPDILDDLMAELDLTADPQPMMQETLQRDQDDRFKKVRAKDAGTSGFKKAMAVCAAVLVVMFAGSSLFDSNKEAFAVVGLDVNPSLEISIDDNEKVIRADALNSDGKAILDGMNLRGSDLKVACNAVLGSMLAKGYLTDTSNSVLVSVRAKDPDKGKNIEQQLTGDLSNFLNSSDLTAAIMGEYIEEDDELEEFAEMYGLSLGKAYLIRNIAATSTNKSKEELVNIPTQELILLAQEKHVPTESAYGNADTSKYIGSEKAIELALDKAGVLRSQASGLKTEFDAEHGVLVYEVEFRANGKEYEYNIDASTGKVVTHECGDGEDDADIDDDDHDDHHDDHHDEDD